MRLFAYNVQKLLMSFGIHSSITANKKRIISWHNGDYESKRSFNVQVPQSYGIKFGERIGFISGSKRSRTRPALDKTKVFVKNISDAGEEDVYDYRMVDGSPPYNSCNGIVMSNCGEQPLPPNGSCCLGSINVSEFASKDGFAWDKLPDIVHTAVRFLDNMITLNNFPTEETKEWSHYHRSIGLGIMGFADALIKMGIRYDSEYAVMFANNLAENMLNLAMDASKELFREKNGSGWDGRRNHVLLSIAPTGTISLLAGCSAGIEPIFSDKITRKDQTGVHVIKHPLAKEDAFVTIKDIDYKSLIDVVAAMSEHVDSSISYTVNMPNNATVDEVRDAIIYAWKNSCNGLTIYRDGSRQKQVLNTTNKPAADVIKRPVALDGRTYKYTGSVDGESTNLYVTVNSNNDRPWEVFVYTPHIESMTELQLITAVTRLSSMSLRYGAPVEKIMDQLLKIEGQSVTSIPAIIARALADYSEIAPGDCPECGKEMVRAGGCSSCPSCGYSECG